MMNKKYRNIQKIENIEDGEANCWQITSVNMVENTYKGLERKEREK